MSIVIRWFLCVVFLYRCLHPMWLVSDWLSFAGVSVPALLLVETNSVPTNRKRAEADASCLRYTCVLTELALGQFGRIKVLRFCTFSPSKPLESSSDSWSLCSQCRCSHKAIWKWYKMHDKWPHGTIRPNKSLYLSCRPAQRWSDRN